MPIEDFSEKIKQLRLSKNMTQREFSAKIGITAATLSAYESGTKSPTLPTAERIATEFNVSLDWLCGITPTRQHEVKTCGEVARLLTQLLSYGLLNIQHDARYYLTFDGTSVPYDLTAIEPCRDTDCEPSWIDRFLLDFMKMSELKELATISTDIFDLWLSSALAELDKQPLDEKEE